MHGGWLFRCLACDLHFRHPRIGDSQLADLYQLASASNWGAPCGERADWKTAIKWLTAALPNGGKILDVGCFDGRFLESLDTRYDRAGIEINSAARARAVGKGISMIGEDFSALESTIGQFDAVTAFDVIEHVPDPRAFLKALTGVLRPGGRIVLSTGNTESVSWRLMGSRYWYCFIAEHISFISPQWVRHAASSFDLEVENCEIFSHGKASWRSSLSQTGANVAYRVLPRLFRWLRSRGAGGIDLSRYPSLIDSPPLWMSAKDHLIVCLKMA